MKPPIYLDNRGDVWIFPDVGAALAWVEPVDVKNSEYRAYDADGRRISLFVRGGEVAYSVEAEPEHVTELESCLRKFFKADPKAPDVRTLAELVAISRNYFFK